MARAWLRFTAAQIELLARDRQLLFWNVVFFLLLLVVFLGALSGGDLSVRVTLTASLVTIGLMASGLFSVAVGLSGARERGVFRRYALAPVPTGTVVLGTVAARAGMVLLGALLQLAVAAVFFDVPRTGGWASCIAVVSLGAAVFAAIGFAIAAEAHSAHVANTLANLVLIPMMALSGTAVPLALMPAAWRDVSWVLPSATIHDLLLGAFVRGEVVTDHLGGFAYLLAWTAVPAAWGSYRWARRGP